MSFPDRRSKTKFKGKMCLLIARLNFCVHVHVLYELEAVELYGSGNWKPSEFHAAEAKEGQMGSPRPNPTFRPMSETFRRKRFLESNCSSVTEASGPTCLPDIFSSHH
ncbi:hypothetical protein ABW19_dt0206865 [Dactylella cylindrospora]|nr:hypothetical protein ABW19_dt0206865 [Dactylella cylindrospora]